jgi:aminoglycoside 6'-N-acetyltransferase
MEMHPMKLRQARISDLKLLQHWDRQPHVMDSDPNDDWNWEVELSRTPAWREQLIAEYDGVPVGFIQIIDPEEEETHYWGGISSGYKAIDIWIGEENSLGKGYGTLMMRLALERCFADRKVNAVLIDPLVSNVRAHRFYERLGFKFLYEHRFGEDDCRIYQLSRQNWDRYQSQATLSNND